MRLDSGLHEKEERKGAECWCRAGLVLGQCWVSAVGLERCLWQLEEASNGFRVGEGL